MIANSVWVVVTNYMFSVVVIRRQSNTFSIMVDLTLNNRDRTKLVQQCFVCRGVILSGTRYHCNNCVQFDLCQPCYEQPNNTIYCGCCAQELVAIAVEQPETIQEQSSSSSSSNRTTTGTDNAEKERSIMLHIMLLEHTVQCQSKSCPSRNCAKMKHFLHHVRICPDNVQGGCRLCKRVWTLFHIHAKTCSDPKNCRIPLCKAIQEKGTVKATRNTKKIGV